MSHDISILQSNKHLETFSNTPFIAPLIVTKVGYFHEAHDHSIYRSTGIDEYILIYCIDGSGFLGDHKPLHLIQKGDIIIIKNHTPHTYGASSCNPWSILWVHFSGRDLDFLLGHFASDTPYFVTHIGYHPSLVDLFHTLIHTFSGNINDFMMLRATTIMQHLLCEIISLEQLSYKQQSHFKDIRQTIHFMKHNLHRKLSLEELSHVANLSKYHFSRKFKDYTNHTPLEYFTRLKIQKAMDLLRTEDLNISEVSETLGYTTPYYFSECFKQVTGYSPSQYKFLIHTKY